MAVRLSVRSNIDGTEGALDFQQEVITLGQGNVDLSLPDEHVSEEHAQLFLYEGQWAVQDVGSATGTLFNGYPLEAGQPVLINVGDILTLGPYDVQFELVEDAAAPAGAPDPYTASPEPGGYEPEAAGYGSAAVEEASPFQQDRDAYPPTPGTRGVRFDEDQDASDKTEVVASAFISHLFDAFGVKEEAPPYLSVLSGNNAGMVVHLRDLNMEMSIGRSHKADFRIEDECISREHARIRRDAMGVYIIDVGSRNGVLINGTQVQQTQRLNSGDEIRLGTTRLKFTDPNVPATGSSLPSKKAEDESEGTIVRPTEAMEVAEIETLLQQQSHAAGHGGHAEYEAEPGYTDPDHEQQPAAYQQATAVAETYEESTPAFPEEEEPPASTYEDVAPQEQELPEPSAEEEELLDEPQLEEEPQAALDEEEELLDEELEEPALEEDEQEEELLEEVDEEEREEYEEEAEEEVEEYDEEEEEYDEEEDEESSRSMLIPLLVVIALLVVGTGVAVVLVLL